MTPMTRGKVFLEVLLSYPYVLSTILDRVQANEAFHSLPGVQTRFHEP